MTKLNPEVIAEGSITADKINIESLKTDSGFVTEDSLTNKIDGKGLSTEDFTTALKIKLEGLSNYDDTTLSNALSTLRSDFDKLVSGDITISGGSSGNGAYSEIDHGTGDITFALTPNTFHVWDEVSSLTLTLGTETSGVANEYLFQFTSGSTATTLSLP